MDEEKGRVEIQQEIDEATASLQQLHTLFEGREMPISVARMERAVRAQLEAAQSLLGL
jgi:hypothetical protein